MELEDEPDSVGIPSPEQCVITRICSEQRLAAIARTLKNVRLRDAELILRVHYRGQTYKEAATALGMTANHVGVALTRVKQRLCKKLSVQHPDLFDPLYP